MFSVIFEVQPRPDGWDDYLEHARMLRPELEQVDGFVDNVRYRSLTRPGWLLSLSGWRDEKAVVRWRTRVRHHDTQEQGRNRILLDYRLRVGQIVHDTRLPPGHRLVEQRLDETEVGEGTTVGFVDAALPVQLLASGSPQEVAERLDLDPSASGLVSWDVFDAVLSPGDAILRTTWRDSAAADAFGATAQLPEGGRMRRVRVVRDYGMFDRREAPQYYPDAPGRPTLRA